MLGGSWFTAADFEGADLSGANLNAANLSTAYLSGADLSRTNLQGSNFTRAILTGANLTAANLSGAVFVESELQNAVLTDCVVYGLSAWNLKLSEGTKQQNLIITPEDEPQITVDNIEVAHFIYPLLHNEKIRDVIDTIGKKGVLLLDRFYRRLDRDIGAIANETPRTRRRPNGLQLRQARDKGFYRDGPVACQAVPFRDCRYHQPSFGAP
jgi:uncharacterized protein YjbI with pentapeptide repeats